MSNFFNAIGVADMEKVHSAMIAWILDDKNDSTMPGANTGSLFSTFKLDTRSDLLCDIFGESRKKFVSIETFVEWNNIDILILTKDQNGQKERWVIENKLKSPEHVSNVKGNTPIWQTQKYTKTITNTFGDKGNHYLLLSLTGNSAKSPNGNWIAKKYEDLRNILSSNHTSASPIIEEYYNAIKVLSDTLNDFLTNYSNYPIAISSKTKNANKSQVLLKSINPNEKYIIENGLETIFQKCLLIDQMSLYRRTCLRLPYTIDETHGNALLDIERGQLKGNVNGAYQEYYVQFEFQNGSFKVQIHQINNNGEMRPKDDFLNEWETVFDEVAKNNTNWKKYLPKPNNKRPFISISKKDKNWYKNIQQSWRNGFTDCEKILQDLITEFYTQNGTQLVLVP